MAQGGGRGRGKTDRGVRASREKGREKGREVERECEEGRETDVENNERVGKSGYGKKVER